MIQSSNILENRMSIVEVGHGETPSKCYVVLAVYCLVGQRGAEAVPNRMFKPIEN